MAGGVRARHAGPSGANGTSRRWCGRNRRRGWSRSASNGYPSVERAPGLLGRGPPHRRPTARRCDPRRLFRPNSTARVARESPDKRPDLGGPAYFRAASPAKRGRGTRRPDVGRLCPTARPSAVTSVSDRAATRKHGCLKQVQIGRYAGRTRRSSPRRGTVIKRCMRSSLAVSSCPLSASSTGAPRVRGAESFRRARRPLDQPEAARPPGTASRPARACQMAGSPVLPHE